ncbi:DNA-binding transcriptional regulator, XRE-family HTH domain [Paenibacillus algorifonticola]|uniref:DNA-binding transcriptional regulator, XRE-family HTH domain n=1 Tax=Paenibacillus algorifonticola TaxID=684063 RepID=A0A1I2D116_9BACL|nr:helix-turn-helix domain-containing protein [Paenibacillus algorifonticola]SFE74218.1 DNA-binding transcriptional regulator, XRE-family HTH domain [Paenibacillus algorifonticola]
MDDIQKKEMGMRIKALREKRGISQEELAEILGMKRTNISNYEAGRAVPPGNIIRDLATELRSTADHILGIESDHIPSWASSKDILDFKKMLEEEHEIMFDGVSMNAADKKRVNDILTGLFWEAKEMNRKEKK